MIGVLLIGGLGTRLRPLSDAIPKSLLPICDKALLDYQVAQLLNAGVERIVLAAGVYADALKKYIAAEFKHVDMIVVEEQTPLGTAGALRNCQHILKNKEFVVLNADIVSEINISSAYNYHQKRGYIATLCGIPVQDPSRYGLFVCDKPINNINPELLLDDKHKDTSSAEPEWPLISGFIEKPKYDVGPGPHFINAGCYVMDSRIFDYIQPDRPVSFEYEVYPQIIKSGSKLGFYPHWGLWYDIGTYQSYYQVNFAILNRLINHDTIHNMPYNDAILDSVNSVYFHSSVDITAAKQTIEEAIIMRDTHIAENCNLKNSLVMPGASIGTEVRIANAIIGPDVEVPAYSTIENQVLVQDSEPLFFGI
ncbi:NDP-sugar synthase [bacterium]|nr:NDP-sugar synthase [bacterium]